MSDGACIALQNLHVGDTRPPDPFCVHRIGPFEVCVEADYDRLVVQIPRKARKTVGADGAKFEPARPGGWVVTASATPREQTAPRSLWVHEPVEDGGLWDLCEILTFVSGRRVTTGDHVERYGAITYAEPCCLEMEVLRTAEVAWRGRQALVDRDVVYALLLYNEALSISLLPACGALMYSALNILYDKLVASYAKTITPAGTSRAMEVVTAALSAETTLTVEERATFAGVASHAIKQGPSSMVDRLIQLLSDHGILPAQIDGVVKQRVLHLNNARNWIAHGRLKKSSELTAEELERYLLVATTAVVPGIIRLVLGRLLGFTEHGLGARSQLVASTLQKFFTEGRWQDWRIKEQSFDEYFRGDWSASE